MKATDVASNKNGELDTRLSYSSASTLLECEQKYWHRKVGKTTVDPDYSEDNTALMVGKAFHKVLEDHKHFDAYARKIDHELLCLAEKACKEYGVESEAHMICAMVIKYIILHRATGLLVHKTEFTVQESNKFIGYIDAILVDPETKEWWIRDMKTSARFDTEILSRLAKDPQLNLYSYFAMYKGMGELMDLSSDDFKGCRYTVVTKSKAALNSKDKDIPSFINRLVKDHVKAFEVVIPVEALSPNEAWIEHMDLWDRAEEFRMGISPRKNYRSCLDKYGKKCGYWSQCYGKTNTDCKSLITIYDADSLETNKQLGDLI